MTPHPPRIFARFLKWFCQDALFECIMGDLEEQFYDDVESFGKGRANRRFAWNVMRFARPGIIKNLEGQLKLNNYSMIKNYFIMAVRNARREKPFTVLNVFCLAVGLTACLYMGLYAVNELGYDRFHEKADRIYRINQTFIWGERDELFGSTGPAVMGAVQDEIPEFETMCRIHPLENVPLASAVGQTEKQIFEEEAIRAVDSTFFDVFTFPLLQGNPETALAHPNSVVLTEETALKYFKTTDVLGRQLHIEDDEVNGTFQITGIAANVPDNSHVTFDMLISMSSIKRLKWSNDSWIWTTFVAFGVLRPDADPQFVAEKVSQVPAKYLEPFLMKYRGITYAEFLETGEPWDLYMQPLLDIHLSGDKVFSRLNETRNVNSLYMMATIALLILVLSVINFVNLSTAKASRRSKEVGVRKVLGSQRLDLIWQFTFESVFYCLLAFTLSLGLLGLFMEDLNGLFEQNISYTSVLDPGLFVPFLGFTIIVGLLAGVYPAFYLSASRLSRVLKGQMTRDGGDGLIRNILVTAQFTISIALIACALIVKNQVQFWLNMDLGFNRNNIIVVQNMDRLGTSMETFKQELLTLPDIANASISTDTPPYIWDGDDNFQIEGSENKGKLSFWIADEDFADIYDLNFIYGRNFDKAKDHEICAVISRSLVERSGFTSPGEVLGRKLLYPEFEARIIGVIEDFETEINWEQLPLAIYFNYDDYYRRNREMSIQYRDGLNRERLISLVSDIEEKWRATHPGLPMNYYFLDQHFENIFEPSVRLGQMIEFYSVLAMIIAGLGLTGLIAYVIERRTKEIGIRKVMGASVQSIVVLLSQKFGKLLMIGFALATGISWYLMSIWVQDYEHQAPIPWYLFVFSGAAMLLVAMLTIGYQTIKSARANPVEALRNE